MGAARNLIEPVGACCRRRGAGPAAQGNGHSANALTLDDHLPGDGPDRGRTDRLARRHQRQREEQEQAEDRGHWRRDAGVRTGLRFSAGSGEEAPKASEADDLVARNNQWPWSDVASHTLTGGEDSLALRKAPGGRDLGRLGAGRGLPDAGCDPPPSDRSDRDSWTAVRP